MKHSRQTKLLNRATQVKVFTEEDKKQYLQCMKAFIQQLNILSKNKSLILDEIKTIENMYIFIIILNKYQLLNLMILFLKLV